MKATRPLAFVSEHDRERFWRLVDVRGENDCWEWRGGRYVNQYGLMRIGSLKDCTRRIMAAHRLSMFMADSSWDQSLHVLHSCDNPPCVNPKHLSPGTDYDNMRDAARKGRTLAGERNPASKLSDVERRRLIKRLMGGERVDHLAAEVGLTYSHVASIRREHLRGPHVD